MTTRTDTGRVGRRLRVERLEERLPLATTTVDTLVDENDGPGGLATSLREALLIAASGDTINFAPALFENGPESIQLVHGQLLITKDITIDGPGAGYLTIDASSLFTEDARIFLIDDGINENLSNVEIAGLRLVGGHVQSGSGGATYNTENLTIADSVITGNSASGNGGGFYHKFGTLNLLRSTISENRSFFGGITAQNGGGIFSLLGNLAITDSTISGNSAHGSGGGIYHTSGNLTVSRSTLDNNEAGVAGGAVSIHAGADDTAIVSNTTVSGNRSYQVAGGIDVHTQPGSIVRFEHSTVAFNVADAGGNGTGTTGGVRQEGAVPVTLDHAIVAINRGFDDLSGAFVAEHSLVGVGDGATIIDAGGNQIGSIVAPLDPLFTPFVEFGDSGMFGLLAGSPAIDAGDASAVGGVGGIPMFDQRGDSFRRVHNGRIDIGAYELQPRGTSTIVVDSLADEQDGNYALGDVSLREAIDLANARTVRARRISFSPTLFTDVSQALISLDLGELTISQSITVEGPGSDRLRIDGAGNGRIFTIDDGNALVTKAVTISGLTITGGFANGAGGAIRSTEHLTVAQSVISGNKSLGTGGGIDARADLLLIASSVTFNRSYGGYQGSLPAGGGISASGRVEIIDSEILSNIARHNFLSLNAYGGGLSSSGDTLIRNSTMSSNTATAAGGGVRADNLVVFNSTFERNFAAQGAGIICDSATITSSQINFNHGDGIHSSGELNVIDSEIGVNSGFGIRSVNDPFGESSLTVTESRITGNGSFLLTGAGGGVDTEVPFTLTSSYIESNRGVGLLIRGTTATVSSAEFGYTTHIHDNKNGGIRAESSTVELNGVTISENSAPDGGGILSDNSRLTISESTIHQNYATGQGGGIAFFGSEALNLTASTIANNRAFLGGGLATDGPAELTNVTVSDNSAEVAGGGIIARASLTLASSTVTLNTANIGGGIWTYLNNPANDSLSITNSLVTGNFAETTNDLFGPQRPDRREVKHSLIGNRLISTGGFNAVHWDPSSGGNGHYYELVIVPGGINWSNANAAATAAGGYLATIMSEAEGTFVFNMLVDNPDAWRIEATSSAGPWLGGLQPTGSAEPAGGWQWVTGEPLAYSNWLAGQPDNFVGNQNRIHYSTLSTILREPTWNDVQTGSTRPIAYVIEYDAQPGEIIADAMLGPVADNGGSTFTHALLPGSPLINRGDPASVAGQNGVPIFDQRGPGFPRVRSDDGIGGARIDVGAFEFGPALPSGAYSLGELVTAADYTTWRDTFGASIPNFSAAYGDGDGVVTALDYDVWKSNFGASPAARPAGSALTTSSSLAKGTETEAQSKDLPAISNPQLAVNPPPHSASSILFEHNVAIGEFESFTRSQQRASSKRAVFDLGLAASRTHDWHGNDRNIPLTLIASASDIHRRTLNFGGLETPAPNNVDFHIHSEAIDHALSSLAIGKGWWRLIE